MKIAWIGHRWNKEDDFSYREELEEYLSKNNLESKIDIEQSLKKFNEKFGSLDNYEILFLHGGISKQGKYINTIPKNHPNLKIYFLSYNPNEYTRYERGDFETLEVCYSLPEIMEESQLGKLIQKLTKN